MQDLLPGIQFFAQDILNLRSNAFLNYDASSFTVSTFEEVIRSYLAGCGIEPGGMKFADGCGLSTLNRLTPRQTVDLLVHMRKHREGKNFISTLPWSEVDGALSYRLPGVRLRICGRTLFGGAKAFITGAVAHKWQYSSIQDHPQKKDVNALWGKYANGGVFEVLRGAGLRHRNKERRGRIRCRYRNSGNSRRKAHLLRLSGIARVLLPVLVLLAWYFIGGTVTCAEWGKVRLIVRSAPCIRGKVIVEYKGKKIAQGETDRPIEIDPIYTPCTVIVESRTYLFFIWRGVKPDFGATIGVNDFTVWQSREIDWKIVILVTFPLFFIIGVYLYRQAKEKAAQARILEEDLRRAEMKTVALDKLPEKIGPYKVLKELGRGGMANVYQVEDKYGDIYALKVPHAYVLKVDEYRKRFIRESEIGKTLNHPNIRRLYDFNAGENGSVPFLTLEYVDGTLLRDILEEKKKLPLKQALKIGREIAEALSYAHKRGVIHRDIKPDNIMLTARDNMVKVMDLGIAKSREMKTLTATGTTLGTPYYLAPEQTESKDADLRSDLYSLGVILYEMIAGRVPFDADEAVQVIIMHLSQPPVPPSRYEPGIPNGVEDMILKLMAKKPQERFQSAEEVVREIDRFLQE